MTMTPAELQERLDRLPRVPLGTLPTPLLEAPRLAGALGIGRLLVKRDDLTGLAFGGNKVRQMEFFLGAAKAAGADLLIAGGQVDQSNHSRVAAAAARAVGLRALIVARPGGTHPGAQGNGLLTRLLAYEFIVMNELADVPADRLAEVALRARVFEKLAETRRTAGDKPYVIVGTSIPLGAMGYVAGTLELLEQLGALGIEHPTVVVTSAGATQAGIEVANRLLGDPIRVVGIAYVPTAGLGSEWVARIATGAAALLDVELAIDATTIWNEDSAAAPAYGVLSAARREAMALAADLEGLLLDPVYTATGMAGVVALARAGRLGPDDTVVFIHTGGLPALFSYAAEIMAPVG